MIERFFVVGWDRSEDSWNVFNDWHSEEPLA